MKAVIDSDILIDYLQGRQSAQIEINRYSQPLFSVISWIEVMCGVKNEDEKVAAENLFHSLERVDVSLAIAAKAVQERKQLKLKLPDALQLATADVAGCILVTRNTRDFDVSDPRVRFPYSIQYP